MLRGRVLTESELAHRCNIEKAVKKEVVPSVGNSAIIISESDGDHIASMLLRGIREYTHKDTSISLNHRGGK